MHPGSLENSPPWAATKNSIRRDRQQIVFARAKYILKYFANTSSRKIYHPHPNQQVGTGKQFQHRVSSGSRRSTSMTRRGKPFGLSECGFLCSLLEPLNHQIRIHLFQFKPFSRKLPNKSRFRELSTLSQTQDSLTVTKKQGNWMQVGFWLR
jgi:hypothetical protein